jgi:hypothetical protein
MAGWSFRTPTQGGSGAALAAAPSLASTEADSAFQCKLDRKPFKPCVSPKKYKRLKPGKHVFKVRAIDKAGTVDPTPAKRSFKVLPS